MIREGGTGIFKERAACPRERSYLCRPIRLDEQRGGTAGGVISRLWLPFQHDHARVRCQPEAYGSTRDAAADDDEIRGYFHTSFRKSATLAAVRLEAMVPNRAVT